jgi:hypothetical protein
MTIRIILLLSVVLVCAFGCKKSESYLADDTLSKHEKELVLPMLVRYIAKPPKMVKGEQRFESRFDEFYKNAQKGFEWELFYLDEKSNTHYFLVTREAPSLYKKRMAIAGSYQLINNELSNYQEIFWTFKMKEPELKEKSVKLFEAMVNGEDLTPYYPQNSPENEEWIEFPDASTYFDADSLVWRKK